MACGSKLDEDLLKEFERILRDRGFSEKNALDAATVFADNSLDGVYSHGYIRFPRVVEYLDHGSIDPKVTAECVQSFGAIERWNGNRGFGPLNAHQAMERAVEAGKLRSIGLSNYYEPDDSDRVVNATTIRPALLQNETHPCHQSGEMKEHIAQYGTVLESWFPLGGRGNTQTLFNDETISSIAAAHGVSSAQVIIRWHLQAGNIRIPGSSNEQHIIEDYDVRNFELTEEEMAQMTALERDDRFADY